MAVTFQIKQRYNIDVYPSAVLGNGFKNVTVLAILNYESALMFADIHAIHANVFAYLPPGTPDRPEEYEYILLKTASGQNTVLARQWINEDSIRLVASSKAIVTIEEVGSDNIEALRAALYQNGFQKIDIRIVS